MNQTLYKSTRYFTLFDYLISHSQLLIRSSKNEVEETNHDIIFFDVKLQYLPTYFTGLSIREISIADFRKIYHPIQSNPNVGSSKIFEIISNGSNFYVCAEFVKVFENKLEFSQSSLGIAAIGRELEIVSSH